MQVLVVRTANRNLAYKLVSVMYEEWRVSWHQHDLVQAAKKISGYIAVVMAIALAIDVIGSAPLRDSGERYATHRVVNGLHIALPENLQGVAIEQLVPLP